MRRGHRNFVLKRKIFGEDHLTGEGGGGKNGDAGAMPTPVHEAGEPRGGSPKGKSISNSKRLSDNQRGRKKEKERIPLGTCDKSANVQSNLVNLWYTSHQKDCWGSLKELRSKGKKDFFIDGRLNTIRKTREFWASATSKYFVGENKETKTVIVAKPCGGFWGGGGGGGETVQNPSAHQIRSSGLMCRQRVRKRKKRTRFKGEENTLTSGREKTKKIGLIQLPK